MFALFAIFLVLGLEAVDAKAKGWHIERIKHIVRKNYTDPTDCSYYEVEYEEIDEFWVEDGPVLLYLNQQSKEDRDLVVAERSTIYYLAQKLKAAVLVYDLRYFGENRPEKSLSLRNLGTLKLREIFSDLSFFVHNQTEHKYKNSDWIVIGMGTAGTVAVNFMANNQRLVQVAVGSSAPVRLDFEYKEGFVAVTDAFKNYDGKCADNLDGFVQSIETLLSTADGRKQLAKSGRLCGGITGELHENYKNIATFKLALALKFYRAVEQHNQKGATLTMKQACAAVGGGDTALEVLGKLSPGCFLSNYTEMLSHMANETAVGADAIYRAKVWLQCTELGTFMTTTSGYGSFASLVNASIFADMCRDAFDKGFTQHYLTEAINYNMDRFLVDPSHFRSLPAVFTLGSKDPIASASFRTAHAPVAQFVLIEDAGSNNDFWPSNKNATDMAERIRVAIGKILQTNSMRFRSLKRKKAA